MPPKASDQTALIALCVADLALTKVAHANQLAPGDLRMLCRLSVLAATGLRVTSRSLADIQGCAISYTSKVCQVLIAAGLVERFSRKDRTRPTPALLLTPAGSLLVSQVQRELRAATRRLQAVEMRPFARVIKKVQK
ncbi:hypothetical protein GCM10023186_41410 [Hymenobacter koreensis]|uniref:MarR family transcriptional regulator n=1 Tax=Hymenobacter koreensis TaxID=1084523 RepID=A0ABP8JJM0_9BACT